MEHLVKAQSYPCISPPQSLNWQNIVDLEGILSVDLSTRVGETADAALPKAVRALQMKQKAQEEIEIVKEDCQLLHCGAFTSSCSSEKNPKWPSNNI